MRYLAALLAMLALTAPARADWEYTRWGMSQDQAIAASKGAVKLMPPDKQEKIDEANLITSAEGTYTDGPLTLRVMFQFDTHSGGLKCVQYGPQDSAQDELLKAAMTKKYGPPKASGIPVASLETLSWKTPTDEIDMEIVEKKIAVVMHCKPQ